MENNNSPFDIVFTSLYHRVFQEFSRISVCMSVETTNKEDKCLIWKKYSEEWKFDIVPNNKKSTYYVSNRYQYDYISICLYMEKIFYYRWK